MELCFSLSNTGSIITHTQTYTHTYSHTNILDISITYKGYLDHFSAQAQKIKNNNYTRKKTL